MRCADFPKMRQLISDVDWENILNPLDLQDAWHYFSTVFDDTVANSTIATTGVAASQEKYLYVT